MGAEFGNKIDKFRFAQTGFDRDLEGIVPRKLINAALGNGIGDQDLGWSHAWEGSTLNGQRSTPNDFARGRLINLAEDE